MRTPARSASEGESTKSVRSPRVSGSRADFQGWTFNCLVKPPPLAVRPERALLFRLASRALSEAVHVHEHVHVNDHVFRQRLMVDVPRRRARACGRVNGKWKMKNGRSVACADRSAPAGIVQPPFDEVLIPKIASTTFFTDCVSKRLGSFGDFAPNEWSLRDSNEFANCQLPFSIFH